MFCEDPEEIKIVEHLCSLNPEYEEHIIDLMTWCYFHKREQYDALLEKHKEFDCENDEHFVDFSKIDYDKLREETIEL